MTITVANRSHVLGESMSSLVQHSASPGYSLTLPDLGPILRPERWPVAASFRCLRDGSPREARWTLPGTVVPADGDGYPPGMITIAATDAAVRGVIVGIIVVIIVALAAYLIARAAGREDIGRLGAAVIGVLGCLLVLLEYL